MSKFYESDSEARWWAGIGGRVILVLLFIGLLSAGGWYFGVKTSGIKGRGEVVKQQNNSNNRIFQQQHFEDLYADYQSSLTKLPAYSQAAKSGDPTATTNLLGLRSHCTDVASTYNQDSRKVLAQDPNGSEFKTFDLPPTLDLTACQESK